LPDDYDTEFAQRVRHRRSADRDVQLSSRCARDLVADKTLSCVPFTLQERATQPWSEVPRPLAGGRQLAFALVGHRGQESSGTA
jgi:hypothetical protein